MNFLHPLQASHIIKLAPIYVTRPLFSVLKHNRSKTIQGQCTNFFLLHSTDASIINSTYFGETTRLPSGIDIVMGLMPRGYGVLR